MTILSYHSNLNPDLFNTRSYPCRYDGGGGRQSPRVWMFLEIPEHSNGTAPSQGRIALKHPLFHKHAMTPASINSLSIPLS
jgi:hypothetical protein